LIVVCGVSANSEPFLLALGLGERWVRLAR
jgi:hypothetical protein